MQKSDDPFDTSQTYRGKAAFSEPETQNIKWLLDEHNGIGYHIDIHCFGGSLLHVWGDDENQSENPVMNFNNSTYNDVRGVDGDGDSEYKEYISKEDNVTNLTTAFHNPFYRCSSKNYEIKQSCYLYPTSGCSDDYAYSRHIKDHNKKVHIRKGCFWRLSAPLGGNGKNHC